MAQGDRGAVDFAVEWLPPLGDDPDGWRGWATQLPICRAVGLVCTAMDESSATFEMRDVPFPANPNSGVNGGIVAAAVDQAMGVLTVRLNGRRFAPATAALHVQYHSPSYPPLTLRATSLGRGSRITFVEVVVEDRDGRRCVTAQGTMSVTRPVTPGGLDHDA